MPPATPSRLQACDSFVATMAGTVEDFDEATKELVGQLQHQPNDIQVIVVPADRRRELDSIKDSSAVGISLEL